MTEEQIAELERLEREATQAPWPLDYVQGAVRHISRNVDRDSFYIMSEGDPDFWWGRHTDGPLIVAMRNALPRLLEERKRLLGALRYVMDHSHEGYAEWKSTARAARVFAEEPLP